jgi:hypothetical protein
MLTPCDGTVDGRRIRLNPASEQAFGRARDGVMVRHQREDTEQMHGSPITYVTAAPFSRSPFLMLYTMRNSTNRVDRGTIESRRAPSTSSSGAALGRSSRQGGPRASRRDNVSPRPKGEANACKRRSRRPRALGCTRAFAAPRPPITRTSSSAGASTGACTRRLRAGHTSRRLEQGDRHERSLAGARRFREGEADTIDARPS